ncbi:MAG: hypothetical protein MUF51_11140 [Vicinamibacteria bacterium]|jgi:hypothetical protein|nr:hypothetical protein [Vicinamibacteria bacterium]
MQRLEHDLKDALRRQQAPSGFAERVLAQALGETPERPSTPRLLFLRRGWTLAAAAALIALIGAGLFARQSYVRQRNEAALHQTLAALEIASTQLTRAEGRAFTRVPWDRLHDRLGANSNP